MTEVLTRPPFLTHGWRSCRHQGTAARMPPPAPTGVRAPLATRRLHNAAKAAALAQLAFTRTILHVLAGQGHGEMTNNPPCPLVFPSSRVTSPSIASRPLPLTPGSQSGGASGGGNGEWLVCGRARHNTAPNSATSTCLHPRTARLPMPRCILCPGTTCTAQKAKPC